MEEAGQRRKRQGRRQRTEQGAMDRRREDRGQRADGRFLNRWSGFLGSKPPRRRSSRSTYRWEEWQTPDRHQPSRR
eukprot:3700081-Heterocapsa_arctica.AAC.1